MSGRGRKTRIFLEAGAAFAEGICHYQEPTRLRSYGFRPQRSTADAIEQCFIALAKGKSPAWVLEGDIKGCFDNISHAWMLAHIPMDAAILEKWLKAGYVENRTLFATEAGTPQGGIISPTLANLTLDGLERLLKENFRAKTINGQPFNPKVNLVRYADDFIITGATREVLENEVKPLVEQFLRDRGLQSRQRKPASRTSSKGSISSAKISASLAAKCSSNRPRKTRTTSWKRCGCASVGAGACLNPK